MFFLLLFSRFRRSQTMRLTHSLISTGQWSPKESELLSRLVQESLAQKRIRTSVERVVDGRQVKDDIDWTAISTRMGGRTANQCLRHWYDVLAPGAVRTGTKVEEWGSVDDQLMLQRWASEICSLVPFFVVLVSM